MNIVEKILVRKWSEFPSNARPNLGFTGLIALGLAIIGANKNLYFGSVIPIADWLAYFLMTIGFCFFIWNSRPRKLILTKTKVNNNVTIEESRDLYPKPKVIGILGRSNSGKSTLINKIKQSNSIPPRTTKNNCFILLNRKSHKSYLALLDGPGDNLPNQFDIIKRADILVIMLDHNHNDQLPTIDNSRLALQSDYNYQYCNQIKSRKKPIKQVHLLLNKNDMWKHNDEQSKSVIINWFNNESEVFNSLDLCERTTFQYHSNFDQTSVNNLLEHISI